MLNFEIDTLVIVQWANFILTSKIFWANNIIGALMIEYALRGIEPMLPKNEEDEKRDEKYKAFRREDLDQLTRWNLMWYAPVILPRWIIGWGVFMLFFLGMVVIGIVAPSDEPFSPRIQAIIAKLARLNVKGFIMMKGSGTVQEIRREYDYSKYLGPDWKLTYENPSTVVSNHTSWIDIVIHFLRQPPAFIGKASIKEIPFAGSIFVKCGCMFFDRSDKNAKKGVLE